MSDLLTMYRTMLDNLNDGVYFVDNGRRIIFWNSAAERITGYTKEEVTDSYCWNNYMSHIDENGTELCTISCPLEKTTLDGQTRNVILYIRHKEGYRLPVSVKALPIYDGKGEISGAIEIFTTISSYIKHTERIAFLKELNLIDGNLDLPDGKYIEHEIDLKIASFKKNGLSPVFALFKIDNRFEPQHKEAVLKILLKTVLHNLSEKDLIGFLGETEFMAIFETPDMSRAKNTMTKLKNLIKKSEIKNGESKFSVTVSAGLTKLRDNDTPETLVARLHYLLKVSRNSGADRISID